MEGASSQYCLPVSLSTGSFLIGPSSDGGGSSINGDGYLWDTCGYSSQQYQLTNCFNAHLRVPHDLLTFLTALIADNLQ